MPNGDDVQNRVPIDVELARDIVHVQSQEIEVRKAELSNAREQDALAHEYAMEALRAQTAALDGERAARERQTMRRGVFALAALALLIAFFCYAIHAGQNTLVVETLRTLTAFALGGAGGYAVGRGRRPADGGSDDTQGG